ncbi:PhzF family phenazine biosynthesis protein [Desulfitobacterium sp. Sab5]|uniref:PhzF family phenazine biosynthesis protein n=1 Tax=Desulfitobacterium nosdiversum TaxID=3375356 RepID=UPI003CF06981
MRPLKIYQVDAFTDKPFSGNPAAICVLDSRGDADWMQMVAQEMNLSETAFLYKEADGYNLRWFTPTVEEELCGHATLASAHILWQEGYINKDQAVKFYTRSGLLTAAKRDGWIELNFPQEQDTEIMAPKNLLQALGIEAKYIGKNRLDYIVEVESEMMVRAIEPNLALLATVSARGVIVTSVSDDKEFDFVSRFFAPRDGILEDPVTGSAHCCLGPYWMQRLGKSELMAYQASKRGGIVKVQVTGDRVLLGGRAVTLFKGDLLV